MYQIDFKKPIHVHFVCIGGISMSALAEMLHLRGFTISGSDDKTSYITEHLENIGIKFYRGLKKGNITPDIDLVVYTGAVSLEHEELVAAKEAGIPIIERGVLLGQIMKQYQHAVGVSGTHGKTSTTSMLSLLLMSAGLDPTILVGAELPNINSTFHVGNSSYFVAESCEYTNSFLNFAPSDIIILNIEAEHLDFFKDIDDIRASFRKFAELVPENGHVIIHGDLDRLDEFTKGLSSNIITFGIESEKDGRPASKYDFAASNLTFDEYGNGNFDLVSKGKLLGHFSLKVPGLQMVTDAVAALAMAYMYSDDASAFQRGFDEFHGAKRRFEYKGSLAGISIYDDYAHHPTEIRATLTAAKKRPHKKLWVVFQPHTYSRLKAFLPDFADALSIADGIVLTDVYAAREENKINTYGVTSKDLEKLLLEKGKDVHHFSTFDEIENFLLENCSPDDMLITMGAGDVVLIAERLLSY